ncbi:MAG: hypothetical protein AAFO95_15745, partial [Cyanobacteria bacterium J06600_6]
MGRLDREREYWLYNRLRAERSNINPQFSFNATCNWIGAIAFLCRCSGFEKSDFAQFYTSVQRRSINATADTLVFEQAFNSFQYLSALEAMKITQQYHYNFIHSAIISWYYGVYFAAGAMIAACDGSSQQDHKGTANAWTNHLVVPRKIVYPFNLSLQTLVKKEYEVEINKLDR